MVKLPDGSLLSYDLSGSLLPGVFHAERYLWNTNQWVDASKVSATNPPQLLDSKTVGNGTDAGFLLPDQQAWFLGGDGNSAYFTPSTDMWSAGPTLPSAMYNGAMTQFGATDNPGALLPNGDVLVALSPVTPRVNGFADPPATHIYEFNPTTQTFTDVTPPGLTNENAVLINMLVLPTGQVLLTNEWGQTQIYTPSGGPVDSWRPTINAVQLNANGSYTLTGTDLNGISEGANTGCYFHMATNYPIVQLQDSSGHVFYARTENWSSTGVATGSTVESTQFTLPSGLPNGTYSLTVIANGISSHPIAFVETTSGATANYLGFPSGFASVASLLKSNGSAKINGSLLQLTDGGTIEAGSAFTTTPVAIGSFTNQFAFQLLNPNADGFTFCIQGAGPTALGAVGGGLGYGATTNGSNPGIPKSIAITFNLYATPGNDSTGLYVNGARPTNAGSINLSNTGINLHSGHIFNVAMAYDGTTLKVAITDTVTGATAAQSYSVNFPSIVGSTSAYLGFTGSTGGTGSLTATQNILSWTYVSSLITPPPPTFVTATASLGQVLLNWTASSGASSYNIYRSLSSNGEGSTPYQIGVMGTSFTDTTVSSGTTYYYQVTAVGIAGEGGPSAEVSATTPQPMMNFSRGFAGASGELSVIGSAKVNGSFLQLTNGATSEAGKRLRQQPREHRRVRHAVQLSAGECDC